ncbi:MAG: PAS domain S-box protein, partial [Bacteroidota bacterium]
MNQSFKDIPGIIDRISDAVVALDSNWCYTYMNKKAGEIFNRDPATMIGKHIWTEFPEDIDQPIYKAYHKAITEQRYIYLEEYYPRYDRWFENHIYPAPEGLSIFFRDITEKKKADEAVKASEKQLDLIYNTIEDVVFLIAVEKEKRFRFQAVNRSFLSVTGLKQEQVLGKYVEEVIPEPSLSLVLSKYKETIQTRQTSRWEEISEFPAGRKTGIVSVTPVFNDTGECVTLVGTVHDITQIKTIEEKLVKANRLYDFLSQINQMIVHTTDAEMLFKKACEISVDIGKFRMAWIGIIDEEMQKVIPVMHAGEDRDYLSKIRNISVNDAAEGRGPTGTAIREGRCIYCNDIEKDPAMAPWKEAALGRGYLSSISLPIKKFGKVIGTYTLYASTINFFNEDEIELLEEAAGDISFALEGFEKETLRKKAEEAVLESERRYQTLAEMSPVGIFHTDASGNTIYVNPRWCQISGLSREEALGDGWLNAVHEEDKKYLIEKWKKATKIQQLSLSEYRFVRPDGTIAWVMGQATPEINSENQIVGYIGTTTNISERKKAEEEIARIYKEKETVLNRINDGVVSVDNEWRYTFINDAALITHPLGREETIGKVIWDVHPEMKGTIFWDKYHEAMETKKTVEVESYYAPMNI